MFFTTYPEDGYIALTTAGYIACALIGLILIVLISLLFRKKKQPEE